MEIVNKYWELMMGESPDERQKAAASWLKWDSLGATVSVDNDNPPASSIELLTSDEDIVKLGLTFFAEKISRYGSCENPDASVLLKVARNVFVLYEKK